MVELNLENLLKSMTEKKKENDPYFMHSRYVWKTAPVVNLSIDSTNNITIYTSDAVRYKISLANSEIMHLLMNEKIKLA